MAVNFDEVNKNIIKEGLDIRFIGIVYEKKVLVFLKSTLLKKRLQKASEKQ